MADHPRIHVCPVETCLEMLSGKWKPRILWKIYQNEVMRFNELQRSISGGITAKMLTQQLRSLERDGLITRVVYPVVPPKVEYRLSEFGRTLIPVLDSIAAWGTENNQQIVEFLQA
ncbi:MAG: helix-turn-helix domain-containing protein [Ardenticatenaceae bacterium]|nr:helix-turn-helix domain-containing protein [Ardenticatenaceae bacterium]